MVRLTTWKVIALAAALFALLSTAPAGAASSTRTDVYSARNVFGRDRRPRTESTNRPADRPVDTGSHRRRWRSGQGRGSSSCRHSLDRRRDTPRWKMDRPCIRRSGRLPAGSDEGHFVLPPPRRACHGSQPSEGRHGDGRRRSFIEAPAGRGRAACRRAPRGGRNSGATLASTLLNWDYCRRLAGADLKRAGGAPCPCDASSLSLQRWLR